MEALTILGLTANICQFVDYAYKIVKEVNASPENITKEVEHASFLAQECLRTAAKITNETAAANGARPLTDDEQGLVRLASRCRELATRMEALSSSIKGQNPGSKLSKFKSILRSAKTKPERGELQKQLDDCCKQLNLQVSNISRSTLSTKLECLVTTTGTTKDDVATIRSTVESIQKSSVVDVQVVVQSLQPVLTAVTTLVQRDAILRRMPYPKMNARFDAVEKAHTGTFEWLLSGVDIPEKERADTPVEESPWRDSDWDIETRKFKKVKHEEFVNWLRGSEISESVGTKPKTPSDLGSIFHLSGKPGAGKSTMMKFIWYHKATVQHLKKWAGTKRLIMAKAFLWRWGEDEAKSMVGLAKCLIHQILEAAPDLHHHVSHILAGGLEAMKLNTPDIIEALDALLEAQDVYENHRFAMFIDGLDEYSGQPMQLVRKICAWAARSPDNIKICVSSREWNEFDIGFQMHPRIRLHQVTSDDLKVLTTTSLMQASNFAESITKEELLMVAHAIVYKSEGVFLWVRVVLDTIEQAVLNCDSFSDLKAKVFAFPEELNGLYQHLLDSTPAIDKKRAYCALIFTGLELDLQFRDLILYKFLDDLESDPGLAKKNRAPLTDVELEKQTKIAQRQLKGLCRGFLQTWPMFKDHSLGRWRVRFMHSTAREFLDLPNVRQQIESYITVEEVFSRSCHAEAIAARLLPLPHGEYDYDVVEVDVTPHAYGYQPSRILRNLLTTFIEGPRIHCPQQYRGFNVSRLLDDVEVIEAALISRAPPCDELKEKGPVDRSHRELRVEPHQVVNYIMARYMVVELFEERDPPHSKSYEARQALLKDEQFIDFVLGFLPDYIYGYRAQRMMYHILRSNYAPSDTGDEATSGDSLATRMLEMVVRTLIHTPVPWWWGNEESSYAYDAIKMCLIFGAQYDDLFVRLDACRDDMYSTVPVLAVKIFCSACNYPKYQWMPLQSMLVQDLLRFDGEVSFEELLECAFPTRYHELYTLMDNAHPVSTSSSATQSTEGYHAEIPAIPLENDKLSFGKVFCGDRETSLHFPNDFTDTGNKPLQDPGCSEHSGACFDEFDDWIQQNATQLYWDDLARLSEHTTKKYTWKWPITEGCGMDWTYDFDIQSVYIQHDPDRDWASGHFPWLSVRPGEFSKSEFFRFDIMWNDSLF